MEAPGSIPVLKQNAVVRRTLGEHHLLVRSDAEIAQIADDVVGLHATNPTTPCHSLRERVRGFAPVDLDDALYVRRDLVRVRAMRGTLFIFSRQLAAIAVVATRSATVASNRRWRTLNEDAYARLAPRILDALAGESLLVTELRSILGSDRDVSAVVGMLCDEGQLVRDRPVGGRNSTQFRYRRWVDVFPDVRLLEYDEMDAIRELLRRYLDCYGPGHRTDLVWWTGLPARKIDDALRGMKKEVVHVAIAGLGDDLLMSADRSPEVDEVESNAATINLLPMLDPYTMGYKDRRRLLDPELDETVIDRGGNFTSVVLVDGRVAGVWDLAPRPGPAARVLLFDGHDRQRRQILEHAGATAAWWFGEPVPVEEYTSMVPLRQWSGVMRRPLDVAQRGSAARSRSVEDGPDTLDLAGGEPTDQENG